MSDTVSSDSVAQDQLRAFIERIMRMREEARAIKDDIREIYAEAKGNGFDKTVLGKVVLYVEQRATKAAELLESEALFDLYLASYDGKTGTENANAHAHEISAADSDVTVVDRTDDDGHHIRITVDQRVAAALAGADAETGEIIESELAETRRDGRGQSEDAGGARPDDAPQTIQRGSHDAGGDVRPADHGEGPHAANAMFGGEPDVVASVSDLEHRVGEEAAPGISASDVEPVAPNSEVAADPDKSGGASASPAPLRLPFRPHCLRPHACGGQGNQHCYSCLKAMNTEAA